jgi:hypothetical protein
VKDKVTQLAKALRNAALELEEVACTCIDRSEGHQPKCVGVSNAKPYFQKAKKVLDKPFVDRVKEDRRRIREALAQEIKKIEALTSGEGGRGDVWVDAARNMYHAALGAVRP